MSQYTFGDGHVAARRLRIVSQVFRESTASLFSLVDGTDVDLAIDLGCGPGYSAHLLARAVRCGRIVGLDSSPNFVKIANQSRTERMSFQVHDVREPPFPSGPSDLLLCRLLLSHLPDPGAVIPAWSRELALGGRLLIEEVEAIHAAHPVLARYLSIVAKMIEHEGADLCVGAALEKLPVPPGLTKKLSRVHRMQVSNRDAASMFSLNVISWSERGFIQDNYPKEEIDQLEAELLEMALSTSNTSDIEWELRHIVLEKTMGVVFQKR